MSARPTRTVRIIERGVHPAWWMKITTVTLMWTCPRCEGPRGEPYNHLFHEDGEWYECDRWDNACGHIDLYSDVALEAADGVDVPGVDAPPAAEAPACP